MNVEILPRGASAGAGFARRLRILPWFPAWRGAILAALFLGLVVPLGVVLAVVTPPGGVADELAHGLRADSLAGGQILGHRQMHVVADGSRHLAAGVDADPALAAATVLNGSGTATAAALARARDATWTGTRSFFEITPLARYMPVFYVPSALALAASKRLGAGPYDAFLAARLANVLAFAVLGAAALLVARRGRAVLFCVLALPMTVSLAGSLNQDGCLIPAAVLGVALATRSAAEDEEGRALGWAWLGAAVLIALVALAKPPYAVLAGLLVLPLRPTDRRWWRRGAAACLAVVPALLWTAWAERHIAVPWPPMPAYAPGPLWPGPADAVFHGPDSAAQMRVLLADPLRIVALTWNTIATDPPLVRETVGILGWLDVQLPRGLYRLWYAALLAACAAELVGGAGPRLRLGRAGGEIAVVGLLAGACVVAIYMSQYLTWTPVGAARVEGPTGRYLLPLLPALAMALPGIPWRGGGAAWLVLAAPAAAAALLGLVLVPLTVVSAMYLG